MRKNYPLLILAAVAIMAAARAWTCDDAFITFRVVSQFLAGHGPVFNIGERVQVFTHPLWFMALTAWAALGGSLFPGVMWLSIAIFTAGLAILWRAFRDKPLALAVVFVAMMFSQSLMDFATGGLETPLTFALFAAALHALRSGRTRVAIAVLALMPLNRLDLLPWVLPFAWIAAAPGWRARATAFVAICAPAAAWIAFSTIYYGAPLPNTAVAKLGIEVWDRLDQGLAYVAGSLAHDPGAMAIVASGVFLAARHGWRLAAGVDRRIAAAGIASAAIGLAYPVWSGGDFMLGRFVLPALWALLAVILAAFPGAAALTAVRADRRAAAFAFTVLASFLVLTGHSTSNLWLGMKDESLMRSVGFVGATDERRVYIPWLGAYAPQRLVIRREAGPPSTGKPIAVGMLGQMGYLGRSDQPLIDIWALADPFLGRFAPLANGRPGHAYRPLPAEFSRWREADHSFGDAELDALARDLRLAHLATDLWSAERAGAIARLAAHRVIPQDALKVADEADTVRIEVKPWKLYRPSPSAEKHVVWMRLHDAGNLRYGAEFSVGLDRDCVKVAVPKELSELTGIEVRGGETLAMRCAKAILGNRAILMRIGMAQVIQGREHVEYDEAIEVVRPALWWISGLPAWLVQGWSEKPKPAVTVAIVLLVVAGLLWRSSRPRPMRNGDGDGGDRGVKRSAVVVFAAVFGMAAARAWASDDAFITFRVVEQFLAGHGPVFNIGERVQVFTHPLWMMALSAWSVLGASLFPGAMWLSLAIFAAGLALLWLAFREKPLALCIAGSLMFFSRTLMDFATGGLETPLSFALFASALCALRSGRGRMAIALLALLPLNRLDLLPWALPFAWIAAGRGRAPRALAALAMCVPAGLWAVFSTIYYGDPLPNTALAKLGGDWTGRLDQGFSFVVGSLVTDPGSFALVIVGIAIAAASLRGAARTRDTEIVAAGALGAAIALAYVIWSGGDFMLGRFMLPVLWALIAVVLAGFPQSPQVEPGVSAGRAGARALVLLALLHLVSGQSSTNLWLDLAQDSPLRVAGFEGALDERRYYISWMDPFSRVNRADLVAPAATASTGKPLLVGPLGRSGYYFRRDQPVIDMWALADPFLGRFAPLPNGRPGHAYRLFPPEFQRWRESDSAFGDARLDALASDLRLAHLSADLWSVARAQAIARLALQRTIPIGDHLRVEREAGEVRITVRPAWLFRPWPHAERYVVSLRLNDADVLDRDCARAKERGDLAGIEVGAGETLTLRCPAARLGGGALLMRVGVPQGVEGREHVEYDEDVELMRPVLWWLPGVPRCAVQGWNERPRAAVIAAILLLAAAAWLWKSGRYTLATPRAE